MIERAILRINLRLAQAWMRLGINRWRERDECHGNNVGSDPSSKLTFPETDTRVKVYLLIR